MKFVVWKNNLAGQIFYKLPPPKKQKFKKIVLILNKNIKNKNCGHFFRILWRIFYNSQKTIICQNRDTHYRYFGTKYIFDSKWFECFNNRIATPNRLILIISNFMNRYDFRYILSRVWRLTIFYCDHSLFYFWKYI